MPRSNSQIFDLIWELQRIPHLQLPVKFDMLPVENELQAISSWSHYNYIKTFSEEEMKRHSAGYSGVALYEFNAQEGYFEDNYEIFGLSNQNVQRDPITNQVLFLPTPLTQRMPKTTEIVNSIGIRNGRTRIVRADPKRSIVWHSHHRGPPIDSYMTEAIIHIPIRTHPLSIHAVRDYRHERGEIDEHKTSEYQALMADSETYVKSYGVGEVWLFNSWHDHYFHNYSPTVRISIVMYLRWFNNEPLLDLIESALERYNGPRLPPDTPEIRAKMGY